jgi:DNA-binding transcriptional LysR family regulator
LVITLRQLEVLVEVVRAGSVTAAAARLFVTQPSVSSTLRALEDELGAPLFVGRGRARRLTPAGETTFRYATQVMGLLDEARQAVIDLGDELAGRLRLLAVTTAGEHLIPEVLERYHATYPAVDIHLMVTNRSQARGPLADGTMDLAVMGRPPAGIDLHAEPFLVNPLHLVCAPDHPVAQAHSVEALATTTLLVREEGSGSRAAVEEALASRGIEPRTMTLGSNTAVRAAARSGLGYAVMPELAVADDLGSGRLVSVRLPGFPLRRRWHVVWRGDRPLSAPAEAFRTELLAWAGERGNGGGER